MLHIFAEPGDISGDRLTITGKEYNHIRNGDLLIINHPEK